MNTGNVISDVLIERLLKPAGSDANDEDVVKRNVSNSKMCRIDIKYIQVSILNKITNLGTDLSLNTITTLVTSKQPTSQFVITITPLESDTRLCVEHQIELDDIFYDMALTKRSIAGRYVNVNNKVYDIYSGSGCILRITACDDSLSDTSAKVRNRYKQQWIKNNSTGGYVSNINRYELINGANHYVHVFNSHNESIFASLESFISYPRNNNFLINDIPADSTDRYFLHRYIKLHNTIDIACDDNPVGIMTYSIGKDANKFNIDTLKNYSYMLLPMLDGIGNKRVTGPYTTVYADITDRRTFITEEQLYKMSKVNGNMLILQVSGEIILARELLTTIDNRPEVNVNGNDNISNAITAETTLRQTLKISKQSDNVLILSNSDGKLVDANKIPHSNFTLTYHPVNSLRATLYRDYDGRFTTEVVNHNGFTLTYNNAPIDCTGYDYVSGIKVHILKLPYGIDGTYYQFIFDVMNPGRIHATALHYDSGNKLINGGVTKYKISPQFGLAVNARDILNTITNKFMRYYTYNFTKWALVDGNNVVKYSLTPVTLDSNGVLVTGTAELNQYNGLHTNLGRSKGPYEVYQRYYNGVERRNDEAEITHNGEVAIAGYYLDYRTSELAVRKIRNTARAETYASMMIERITEFTDRLKNVQPDEVVKTGWTAWVDIPGDTTVDTTANAIPTVRSKNATTLLTTEDEYRYKYAGYLRTDFTHAYELKINIVDGWNDMPDNMHVTTLDVSLTMPTINNSVVNHPITAPTIVDKTEYQFIQSTVTRNTYKYTQYKSRYYEWEYAGSTGSTVTTTNTTSQPGATSGEDPTTYEYRWVMTACYTSGSSTNRTWKRERRLKSVSTSTVMLLPTLVNVPTGVTLNNPSSTTLTSETTLTSPIILASSTKLPANTKLPAGTILPNGTTLTSTSTITTETMYTGVMVLPNGITLPNGTTLQYRYTPYADTNVAPTSGNTVYQKQIKIGYNTNPWADITTTTSTHEFTTFDDDAYSAVEYRYANNGSGTYSGYTYNDYRRQKRNVDYSAWTIETGGTPANDFTSKDPNNNFYRIKQTSQTIPTPATSTVTTGNPEVRYRYTLAECIQENDGLKYIYVLKKRTINVTAGWTTSYTYSILGTAPPPDYYVTNTAITTYTRTTATATCTKYTMQSKRTTETDWHNDGTADSTTTTTDAPPGPDDKITPATYNAAVHAPTPPTDTNVTVNNKVTVTNYRYRLYSTTRYNTYQKQTRRRTVYYKVDIQTLINWAKDNTWIPAVNNWRTTWKNEINALNMTAYAGNYTTLTTTLDANYNTLKADITLAGNILPWHCDENVTFATTVDNSMATYKNNGTLFATYITNTYSDETAAKLATLNGLQATCFTNQYADAIQHNLATFDPAYTNANITTANTTLTTANNTYANLVTNNANSYINIRNNSTNTKRTEVANKITEIRNNSKNEIYFNNGGDSASYTILHNAHCLTSHADGKPLFEFSTVWIVSCYNSLQLINRYVDVTVNIDTTDRYKFIYKRDTDYHTLDNVTDKITNISYLKLQNVRRIGDNASTTVTELPRCNIDFIRKPYCMFMRGDVRYIPYINETSFTTTTIDALHSDAKAVKLTYTTGKGFSVDNNQYFGLRDIRNNEVARIINGSSITLQYIHSTYYIHNVYVRQIDQRGIADRKVLDQTLDIAYDNTNKTRVPNLPSLTYAPFVPLNVIRSICLNSAVPDALLCSASQDIKGYTIFDIDHFPALSKTYNVGGANDLLYTTIEASMNDINSAIISTVFNRHVDKYVAKSQAYNPYNIDTQIDDPPNVLADVKAILPTLFIHPDNSKLTYVSPTADRNGRVGIVNTYNPATKTHKLRVFDTVKPYIAVPICNSVIHDKIPHTDDTNTSTIQYYDAFDEYQKLLYKSYNATNKTYELSANESTYNEGITAIRIDGTTEDVDISITDNATLKYKLSDIRLIPADYLTNVSYVETSIPRLETGNNTYVGAYACTRDPYALTTYLIDDTSKNITTITAGAYHVNIAQYNDEIANTAYKYARLHISDQTMVLVAVLDSRGQKYTKHEYDNYFNIAKSIHCFNNVSFAYTPNLYENGYVQHNEGEYYKFNKNGKSYYYKFDECKFTLQITRNACLLPYNNASIQYSMIPNHTNPVITTYREFINSTPETIYRDNLLKGYLDIRFRAKLMPVDPLNAIRIAKLSISHQRYVENDLTNKTLLKYRDVECKGINQYRDVSNYLKIVNVNIGGNLHVIKDNNLVPHIGAYGVVVDCQYDTNARYGMSNMTVGITEQFNEQSHDGVFLNPNGTNSTIITPASTRDSPGVLDINSMMLIRKYTVGKSKVVGVGFVANNTYSFTDYYKTIIFNTQGVVGDIWVESDELNKAISSLNVYNHANTNSYRKTISGNVYENIEQYHTLPKYRNTFDIYANIYSYNPNHNDSVAVPIANNVNRFVYTVRPNKTQNGLGITRSDKLLCTVNAMTIPAFVPTNNAIVPSFAKTVSAVITAASYKESVVYTYDVSFSKVEYDAAPQLFGIKNAKCRLAPFVNPATIFPDKLKYTFKSNMIERKTPIGISGFNYDLNTSDNISFLIAGVRNINRNEIVNEYKLMFRRFEQYDDTVHRDITNITTNIGNKYHYDTNAKIVETKDFSFKYDVVKGINNNAGKEFIVRTMNVKENVDPLTGAITEEIIDKDLPKVHELPIFYTKMDTLCVTTGNMQQGRLTEPTVKNFKNLTSDANAKDTTYQTNDIVENQELLFDTYFNTIRSNIASEKKSFTLLEMYGNPARGIQFGFDCIPVTSAPVKSKTLDFLNVTQDINFNEDHDCFKMNNVVDYDKGTYSIIKNAYELNDYEDRVQYADHFYYNFTIDDDLWKRLGFNPCVVNYDNLIRYDRYDKTLDADTVYAIKGKYYSEEIYNGPVYTPHDINIKSKKMIKVTETSSRRVVTTSTVKPTENILELDNTTLNNYFNKKIHYGERMAELSIPTNIDIHVTQNEDVEKIVNDVDRFVNGAGLIGSYNIIRPNEPVYNNIQQSIPIDTTITLPDRGAMYVYLSSPNQRYPIINSISMLNVEYIK